ncbi:MAG: adenylate/guanylate cyclase domain-containing protein [Rhodobacteraceae bacterium]|nr:adenylate/guanylate cyclase domain-containing protein [Paracoccaceae bacterium]
MSILWQGSWTTRIRIGSGLVLFLFALLHFINLGLGLISPDWMEVFQTGRQYVTHSAPGTVILYAAFLAHIGLAIVSLAARRTLKMPIWEATQIALGLAVPFLLIKHIVHARMAHKMFAVNIDYGYVSVLLWNTADGVWQSVLLLIVWVHGCMGLHFWLRVTKWWKRWIPVMTSVAVLVPAFALAGFLTEGRRMLELFAQQETRASEMERFNFPEPAEFNTLIATADYILYGFWAILIASALFFLGRKLTNKRHSVRISYVDGPEVSSPKGPTLLEISRANGIPHTALCGGRGRCTTCRVVIEDGADLLHPPSTAEARSLAAVNAPPNARLACQIKPTNPLTVFRVFRPDGKRGRAHASQGSEQRLAVMFLDMRGFTARTTGQLPYDVVFLLNRFFDAVVPSIVGADGSIDKYLGDGLMAVFECKTESESAKAALKAAAGISSALITFNRGLAAEGVDKVAIGIGIHLGEVVIGEIGAAGNAPRTLIGNTVNTASRLESKTKDLEVELLVSEPLLLAAGHATDHLDMITPELRGVTRPLNVLAVKSGAALFEILEPKTGVAAEVMPAEI